MTFGEVAMPAAGGEETVESIDDIIIEAKSYIIAKGNFSDKNIVYRTEYQIWMNEMAQEDQGEGQQLAIEHRKLVEELNEKAHETLHFKMEASQNFSTLAIMKEQLELMKNEENMMRDDAYKRMSFLESGARELRNSLDREEHAKSEVMTKLQQVEMAAGSDSGTGKVTSDGLSNVPQVVSDECMGDSVGASVIPIMENTRDASQFRTFLQVEVMAQVAPTLSSQKGRMCYVELNSKIYYEIKECGGRLCRRPRLHERSPISSKRMTTTKARDSKHVLSKRMLGVPTKRSRENVNDGRNLRLNAYITWMNFVLNYVMPKKMRTEYVVSASVGDKKPNTIDRKTIMMMIMEKVRKKKQYHLPSRPPTLAQVDGPGGGGPDGPGDGDGSKKSPSHRGGPKGGDPPGPPSDAPTDEGVADVTDVKILRREADKVIVPPFPKVTHLDSWMSYCIANVLGACADPNHEEWIAWLNPAFRPNPDIDGLNDSGHIKFKSIDIIDIKLGIAMSAMLKAAGDNALDLYLDVNRKSSKYVREESKLIKGRQIIAMMYESFRTRDRLDMIVTLEYLIKLQYQGDQRMSVFQQTWLECIDRMRPEDDSPALKWQLLVSYDMLNYDDPKRYGFVWPPGENPFMINPEGKRISLFVNGDIPYVRAGSQKSIAHYDEMATTIKSILEQSKEGNSVKALNAVAATCDATPGEEEEPDSPAEEYSPDFMPDEVPCEEVPAEEAGRPPDIPDDGDEPVHDDDEREIEIEGDGAPTRKAKVGTLKAEAKTLTHLCTHRYRNPDCEACIRAKMKHYRTMRGACKRELKAWGDLITFDFLDMRRAADMGIGSDDEMREVLVIREVATRVIAAIPAMSRNTEDVVEALKRLIGRRKVKLAYSDVAPEFDAAMAQLKIPIDHSLPGLPRNNSLAERTNQEVINTVATSPLHAGLPAQYWHFALNCVTHNLNIEDVEGDGDSAWKRMTGEDFKGKAIPFGAKVFFKTTDTRDKTYAGKFDPKGIPGIFAGYVIATGQQWSRKYKVWDMAEFAGVNLSMDAAVPRKLAQPYLTEVVTVVVLPEDLVFPLKGEYERMNSTLEGLNDNRRLQGKEIKDADYVGRSPSGGDDDSDDDDDESKKKPPPDPDEIDDGTGSGAIPLDDYY
ncbi:unnamed protein product [Symbiodinium sp. KB8]|nr:unnamed protein product [Symbiodinium sp. KB8]